MKKTILFSLIFSFFTLFAFAQGGNPNAKTPKTPEERATMRTNRMEKQLKLTADQKTTIYQANLEAAQKNTELRTKVKAKEIDRNTANSQKKEIETTRDSKITATLDADQKAKYELMKAKAIEKGKKRMEARKANRGKKGPKNKPAENDDDDLEDDSEDF